jgi:probable F420-dependent oxidoreductase
MRPFRFLAEARDVASARELGEKARRAEGLGFDALVIPDHLIDQLAPVPAMAVIAAATQRLRIGTFVFNNDLRHPAVLAQDLASLDVLSEGRLEIGIGAGWNRPEYEQSGIPFEPARVRTERLAEAVTVLKGLFAEGPFSFRGEHYTITDMDGLPKPVQRPHPPFMIGGGGRRTLTLAGREAQTVSLAPRLLPTGRGDPTSLTLAASAEKIAWIREAAGDRFDELEINVYPSLSPVVVTDHPLAEAEALADRLAAESDVRVGADVLLEAPNIFIASMDGFVDKFQMLRERLGISCIMVGGIDDLAPVVTRLAGT